MCAPAGTAPQLIQERGGAPVTRSSRAVAEPATVFGPPTVAHVFAAANYVSLADYYKALRELRPVVKYEHELLNHIQSQGDGADTVAEPEPAEARP